jgi:hypothetical protein
MLALVAAEAAAGPKIADHRMTVDAGAAEPCEPSGGRFPVPAGYVLAPAAMLDGAARGTVGYASPPLQNVGANEGRLRSELRQAARLADPASDLRAAAIEIALGNAALGRAYADLAVTGRRSFARFRESPPDERAIFGAARAEPRLKTTADSALRNAVKAALDRAYAVAQALRLPSRSPERKALGWIAVSGEDDPPYRPVNVPSTDFPQYDLTVSVRGQSIRTRYMIAQSKAPARPSPALTPRQLPPEPVPALADDAEVYLYIHSAHFALEEAEDLAKALEKLSQKDGRNHTVIAVDLPASGYADKIDHLKISPMSALGEPKGLADFDAHGVHNVPVLDFIDDFVVAFAEALDRLVALKKKLKAIVGGSLGGNITLRLGRRQSVPWMQNFVAWSPGAIWNSFADGADPFHHIVVRKSWSSAGGDPKVLSEAAATRRDFFKTAWSSTAPGMPAQPQMWWTDKWACKDSRIVAARLEHYEIYNRELRLWHWRLATEQLIYSHRAQDPKTGKPLIEENRKNTLLLCGRDDNYPFGGICSATESAAKGMSDTPGKALFVLNTGHQIGNERPLWLAYQIAAFLHPAPRFLSVVATVHTGEDTIREGSKAWLKVQVRTEASCRVERSRSLPRTPSGRRRTRWQRSASPSARRSAPRTSSASTSGTSRAAASDAPGTIGRSPT